MNESVQMKSVIHFIFIIFFLFAAASFAQGPPRPDLVSPPAPIIGVDELAKMVDTEKHILLLDVRSKKAYDNGHIPTARNMPTWEIEQRTSELPQDKDARIIVYCDGTGCPVSFYGAEILIKLQYKNVMIFTGGTSAFVQSGESLITPDMEQLPQMPIPDLWAMVQAGGGGSWLIDARPKIYYDLGTLPGAENISPDFFKPQQPAAKQSQGQTQPAKQTSPDQNLQKPNPYPAYMALPSDGKAANPAPQIHLPEDHSAMLVVFGEGLHDGRPYVVAKELGKKGYSKVFVFPGGYSTWKRLGP